MPRIEGAVSFAVLSGRRSRSSPWKGLLGLSCFLRSRSPCSRLSSDLDVEVAKMDISEARWSSCYEVILSMECADIA